MEKLEEIEMPEWVKQLDAILTGKKPDSAAKDTTEKQTASS